METFAAIVVAAVIVALVFLGIIFIALAIRVARTSGTDRRAARGLFAFSILYLFVLFGALLAERMTEAGTFAFR